MRLSRSACCRRRTARSGSWPTKQKLQWRPHVQRGTDQQPQVGQGIAVQQVGLVEDQQQGALGPRGAFQDLFVKAFFAAPRRLAQLRDDQLQQAGRRQVGEVAVLGLTVLRQLAVEEAFQRRGFTRRRWGR